MKPGHPLRFIVSCLLQSLPCNGQIHVAFKHCFIPVNNTHSGGETENPAPTANGSGPTGGDAPPKPREPKQRSNRPPTFRRNDNKPKEALVNGTTA